jgi:hypothetical protein
MIALGGIIRNSTARPIAGAYGRGFTTRKDLACSLPSMAIPQVSGAGRHARMTGRSSTLYRHQRNEAQNTQEGGTK